LRILRFLIKRLFQLVPVVIGLVTITFLLMNVIPSNPVRLAVGPQATMETEERVRQEFGLDRPIWEQYTNYLGRLLRGDLGNSLMTRRPVREDIERRLPATIELAIVSMVLGVSIGIVLGVASAIRRDQLIDHISRLLAISGVSMPSFWLGLLVQLLLGSALSLFPITGRIGFDVLSPSKITGLFLVDSLLVGDFSAFASSFRHMFLPAFTLCVPVLALTTRLTRSGMLEVLNQDYITNARAAAGLPERIVIYKYALKNGLMATISQIGLSFGALLSGSVLVETVFDWPGLGLYIVTASINQDIQPIVGSTIVVGIIFVLVNILTDITYSFFDPRIEL
jgi:peptide/nickel transport system permease protein